MFDVNILIWSKAKFVRVANEEQFHKDHLCD